MKYLLIGAGAIGSYLGGSLLSAGKDVSFLEKPEYAGSLNQNGITIKFANQIIHHAPVNVFTSADLAFSREVDVVVFAIKSFDTEEAAKELFAFREKIKAVLCLQNGVENEPILERYFGENKVIGGSVTSAIGRVSAGDVILEKLRGIGIEKKSSYSDEIITDFNEAGLNAKPFQHRLDMKWSKMLSNLLLNASCAILDMIPAEIMMSKAIFHLEMQQFKEAVAVMDKLGVHVTNLPKVPMRTLSILIKYFPEDILRKVLVKPLGGGRGAKMPSLHIDLQQGRNQSEVIFLNGAVSRIGRKVGVPTPVNNTFSEILTYLVAHPDTKPQYSQNYQALLSKVREEEMANGQ